MTREVPIPFSDEEIARLEQLARDEGATLGEYVRYRVFGPREDDPVAILASREGERIRAELAGMALFERVVDALVMVRDQVRGMRRG